MPLNMHLKKVFTFQKEKCCHHDRRLCIRVSNIAQLSRSHCAMLCTFIYVYVRVRVKGVLWVFLLRDCNIITFLLNTVKLLRMICLSSLIRKQTCSLISKYTYILERIQTGYKNLWLLLYLNVNKKSITIQVK